MAAKKQQRFHHFTFLLFKLRIAQFTNKGDIKGHSLKSGHETQDPATWGPRHETLRPGNLGPWDIGP